MRTLRISAESNTPQRSEGKRRLTNALHWTPALLRIRGNMKGYILAEASEHYR